MEDWLLIGLRRSCRRREAKGLTSMRSDDADLNDGKTNTNPEHGNKQKHG